MTRRAGTRLRISTTIPFLLTSLLLAAIYVQRNVLYVLQHIEPGEHSDFRNYYEAARRILAGQSPFMVADYDYPTLISFLILPLASAPYGAARMDWLALSQVFLLAGAWTLWRSEEASRRAFVTIAVVWTIGGTVGENLFIGQIYPLLLLMIAISSSNLPAFRPVALWFSSSIAPASTLVLMAIFLTEIRRSSAPAVGWSAGASVAP